MNQRFEQSHLDPAQQDHNCQLHRRAMLAFCIRKFLTKVLTPLTGFIQRQKLSENTQLPSIWSKIKYDIVYWISSRCRGVITFAYPEIPYNPILARRQENQREWTSALLGISTAQLKKIATEFLIKEQRSTPLVISKKRVPLSFTILVCFHHHLDYFKACLHSIQEAMRHSPSTEIEVLIINDDPSIDLSTLLADCDFSLRQKIVLRSHVENLGICCSLNDAITHAQGEWLVYLDCDDLLEPSTFSVLERTIAEHPAARFISSRAIDIDADSDILFWRLRSEHPYELIKNNFAGHLKVIKKELHQDLGLFKKTFEGCQDYEFALRTAINEPLLFIPHYLYRYRWHHDTQTVSQNQRQNLIAMRVRQSYMLAIYWLTHGTEMIEWDVTGPCADEWKEHLASISNKNSKNQIRYHVTLEANTAYDARRLKLLLVEIATLIIDRYRENDTNRKIVITI
ncbi:MAG: glycosyltransferase [Chthoniobacterales bacterium]|nr:glycosyltransferase [Chthoniobacterales bacterium]